MAKMCDGVLMVVRSNATHSMWPAKLVRNSLIRR